MSFARQDPPFDEQAGTRTVAASPAETGYIEAMSRDEVVDAYSTWTSISDAEAMCLDRAFQPGSRVLDLGCGAGRLATRIGRLCRSYLGVDASAQMIRAARTNCPELVFVTADIVEFTAEPASYDLILLMGNVLDYLHPEERRTRLLSHCHSWLTPEGAIVGSSHLTSPGQPRGYYAEDYHGAQVSNHRASLAEIIDEIESQRFEVLVATRDNRVVPADWSYWVARPLA
jgi:SAM-dependent methyltransferase